MSEHKQSNVLRQFATIGLGTLINMILGLISTPIVTRIVDPEVFGELSIFTTYQGIAVMVLCLGLDQALVRYYYIHDDFKYKRALLMKCIMLPVIITIITMLVVSFLSLSGVVIFEFSPLIMILLCICVFIQLLYRFSLLLVRLERKTTLFSGLQVIQKIVYIIITITFCILLKKHYIFILTCGVTIAAMVALIVSIVSQKSIWSFTLSNKNECEFSMEELLKYSMPFIISLGIQTLFQAIDKISLNTYCTYTEVGIYSSTLSIVSIFAIIQTSFNALWGPMAIEHYAKHPDDTEFHKNANQYITVVMFFFGVSLIACKDLFALMLGEKYRQAASILPFLIFNPIMYTISETTVVGLNFKKKSSLQIIIALTACITNIVGNALLVPALGPQGAAISTGCSYIVFYYMRTLLGSKYYKVNFELPKFTILTIVASVYCFYNTFYSFSIFSIIGAVVCYVVLFVLYYNEVIFCIKSCINSVKRMLNKRNTGY